MGQPPTLRVSRDVSAVAPLDGRAAVTCPMRIHLRIDPPGDGARAPLPAVLQARIQEATSFRRRILDGLGHRLTGLVDVGGDADRTLAAMRGGAAGIVGARLDDLAHRRTGRPHLLLRAHRRPDGRWGYLPVDVRAHLLARDVARDHVGPLRATTLDAIGRVDVTALPADPARWARRHPRDQMQLAHHHRLLQAAGHDLPHTACGGIVGTEELLAVYDLQRRGWPSWRTTPGRWTTLERYDHEFGFRLDVAAVAHDRAAGSDEAPVVVPAWSSAECPACEFRDHCLPRMEAADELTLLPGVDWDLRHRLLRSEGIGTRRQLAALPHVAAPTRTIATASDEARVVTAGGRPCRARGVGALELPRAEVEVDVDVECTADGRAYLWGCLVSGTDDDGYVAFADLSAELDDVAVFTRFWAWFTDLRATALAGGRSFLAYCYHAGSENRFLRTYAGLTGVVDEVAALTSGPHWIDVHHVVRRHLITGGSRSLKRIAPLAGFTWRDPDAGGAESLRWYAQAVAGDRDAADRLLAYNADDVAATRAVREWLSRTWDDLPDIDELCPGTSDRQPVAAIISPQTRQ